MIIQSVKHKGTGVKISTDHGSTSFSTDSEISFTHLEGFEVNSLEDLLKLPHELHLPILNLHKRKWRLISSTKKIPRPLNIVLRKDFGIHEFSLVSYDAKSFSDAYEANEKIAHLFYKKLKKAGYIVKDEKIDASVDDQSILFLLKGSIEEISEEFPCSVRIGVGFYNYDQGHYHYHGKQLTDAEQLEYVCSLVKAFDIGYVEAPFYETQLKTYLSLKDAVFQSCLVCYSSKIHEFTVALFEHSFTAVLFDYSNLTDFRDNLHAFTEHKITSVVSTTIENANVVIGFEIILSKFSLQDSDLVKYFKKAEISIRESNA